MFKSINIRNFKAIQSLDLEFNQINVLIGANASGKTTILQALDFLFNCVSRDATEYLKDRGWKLEDIKNQHLGRSISFSSNIVIEIDGKDEELAWDIAFQINVSDGTIKLYRESIGIVVAHDLDITDPKNPKPMKGYSRLGDFYDKGDLIFESKSGTIVHRPLKFDDKGAQFFDSKNSDYVTSPYLVRSSSILKDINIDKHKETYPKLARLKEYILSCQSFEMLSPERLKHSSRGKADSIGRSGEKLGAFIRQFQNGTKEHFISCLQELIPNITSISTSVRGKPGWIELILKEAYGDKDYMTKSNHISDGVLRIIALVALSEISATEGMILLDEIEDGLNPHMTSKIVNMLRAYVNNTNRQILLTTHSSVMLDDFKPEEILFVYRDEIGSVNIKRAFTDVQVIKEMLEYMNPGEIWLNVEDSDLSQYTK